MISHIWIKNWKKKKDLSRCVLEFVQNLFSYELCITN